MKINLPYGKKALPLEVPDTNLLDVLSPKEIIPHERADFIIKHALEKPMGTNRLSDIASRGDRVAIVVDDYTRPCPNEKMLLPVLEELKVAGVSDSDILVIVATGTHTPPSYEKIKEIVGDKVSRNYNVISNDVVNGDHAQIGISKRGNTVEILRDYVDADVKIILCDIEYHYFAGYGGTRKSILPGIASKNTIQSNHSMLFEEGSSTGVLHGNHLSEEMNEAMHMAGCDFSLGVVLNSDHQIVGAWSGRPESVMDAGVKLVNSMYKVEVKDVPDIVVVGANGHPHDINMYQAMKAMHTGCQVVKDNGVIVLVAKCPEGHGSNLYVDWLKTNKNSGEVQKALEENFIIGAHKAYYHYKAVENHTIILVSDIDKSEVEDLFNFKQADNPDDALKMAFDITGKEAKVLVVPMGTTTHLVCSS